jgi:hypothetical protein
MFFAEVLVPGGGGADDAGGQFWHHLGLDLTIPVIKRQIRLARQSIYIQIVFAEVLLPGGGGADDAGGQLWHPPEHLCRLLLH